MFDTVIHYDLSWNPTRHQQREGRVDRFGQPAQLVRSVLLYSPDSAIDGAVLEVILRKAEAIRKATGVTVPLPEEREAVTGALMNAVLLHKGRTEQLSLDFGFARDAAALETRWRDAEEGERRSRARFAQNAIKPEEVAPEWRRWRELLGGPVEVRQFVERAMSRLDAPLEPGTAGDVRGSSGRTAQRRVGTPCGARSGRLDPPGLRRAAPAGATVVVRSHPLPATLAEALLEGALNPGSSPVPSLGRTGAWPTSAVKVLTTVAILRLRYKLTVHGRRERLLLVEEAGAIAFQGSERGPFATGETARALLEAEASGNLAEVARNRLWPRRGSASRPHWARIDRGLCARAGTGVGQGSCSGARRRRERSACHRRSRFSQPTSSAFSFSLREASEMARIRKSAAALSTAITLEGTLISPAMLARIAAHEAGEPDRSRLRVPRASRYATRSLATSVSARRCSPSCLPARHLRRVRRSLSSRR